MEQRNICYNCFQPHEGDGPCPYCGFDLTEHIQKYPMALRPGTVLNDRYVVGRVLGQGGFGITYLAFDTQLNARVAIKEFMPGEIATRVDGTTVSVVVGDKTEDFAYGADRFLEEARTLAKFAGNPNIAGVSSYFQENDTSYFVMEYIEGVSFKTYIANHGGAVGVDDALNVMIPVLRALSAVHREGFIHRDVTPDNIYITKDGNVKLLDFGSARYSIGDKSKSLDVILKVGYAPKEQYIRRGRQGPFTDVYSCAACFYAALTGYLPPESLERLENDPLVPVSQCGVAIPEYLDKAILKGLAVQPEDRFQSAEEFLSAIESQTIVTLPGQTGSETKPAPGGKKWIAAAVAAGLILVLALGMFLGGRGGEPNTPDGTGVPGGPDGYQGPDYSDKVGDDGNHREENDNGGDQNALQPITVTIDGQEYNEYTSYIQLRQPLTQAEREAICQLPSLTGLYIIRGFDEDFSFLADLPGLTSLTFTPTSEADLDYIAGLTGLTSLTVSADGDNPLYLNDLSVLKNMTALERLSLSNIRGLEDLSALAAMTGLTSLDIYGDVYGEGESADLTQLAALTRLQRLSLQGFRAEDLFFLSGMGDLEELYLGLKGLKSLSGMENAGKLTRFILDGSVQLTTLAPLSGLVNLELIDIRTSDYSVHLADLTGLERLSKVETLTLRYPVDSLRGVEGMTGLTALNVDVTGGDGYCTAHIDDLSPLSGLTQLQTLDLNLGFNPGVHDLNALRALTNLTHLYVYANRAITDASAVEHLPDVTIY